MSEQKKPDLNQNTTVRDFAVLIQRFKDKIDRAGMIADTSEWLFEDPQSAARELVPLGWDEPGSRLSYIVTSDRTAVELGPPSLVSLDILMTTSNTGLITDGKVMLLGNDLPDRSHKESGFLQAVLLALSPETDTDQFVLERKRYLLNRIPGYMVRAVPGRLWVRIDHDLMAQGFSFYHLGCALYTAFRGEVEGVLGCEVVFGAGNDDLLNRFEDISRQAQVLSRENKKLQLDPDGTYSCTDLDCDSCEEKPYCDEIKDLIKYRKERKST